MKLSYPDATQTQTLAPIEKVELKNCSSNIYETSSLSNRNVSSGLYFDNTASKRLSPGVVISKIEASNSLATHINSDPLLSKGGNGILYRNDTAI